MTTHPARRALATAFLLVLAAAPAFAQEDPVKEAAAWVQVAAPAVRRGDWETARTQLEKARTADPANADAALLLARVQERTGDVRKALETVGSLAPAVRPLTRKAELLLLVGDAAGAEAAAREALKLDEASLSARRALGAALEEQGKREAATEQYVEVNKLWSRNEGADTDEDLLAVARARLGVFRCSDEYRADANGVVRRFEELLKRKEPPEEAYLEAADLYLRGHSDMEAKRWYAKAAEVNPRSADAIFGLARQMAFRYDDIGAQKEAERALRENPRHVPSLVFLAQIAAGDGTYARADELVAQALAVNPEEPQARGLRGALHYLRGAQGAFEAEVKSVLARNRFQSAPYRVLARALEEQRRFPEALEFAERAAQVDPLDWEAYFAAGRNALNVGDDAKAERYLRAAEKGDPFPNRYRRNFLILFDAMAKFPVVRAGRFEVKLPREIEEAYVPLVTRTMEESLTSLERKWEFVSGAPVFVSIFDRQDDFATRTIGLPGFPALGACFGRVVTLDSPRALPPGAFGWRATLHHEFAHVITLQLSKGRVPRWLTEGISVYEERKVSPTWNREMERDLADAIASGEVLTLADVNNAFRGARVLYAYYQGGLMCELIERDFGFPRLREMVRLYGEGFDTPDVVRKALGVEPAEFDRRFLAYAKEYVAALKVLPRPSPEATAKLRVRLRKDAADADGWALLALGQLARGDTAAALQSVGRLAELRPDSGRAATIRALLALRQKRPDQAAEFAKEAIARGDDNFDLRMALAMHAKETKDFTEAKEHLQRAIELFPVVSGPQSPRLLLAEMLLGEGESQLEAAMKLTEDHARVAEDDFASRAKLAGWYRDRGRSDDELRTLEEMRDVVPLPNGPWKREACADLHERLAQLYLDRKRWPDAELAARTAASVASMALRKGEDPPPPEPQRAELVALHAETLHLLGRDDDARRRADEALRLDPANERAGALAEKLKP
jgi:tetratricopeptide (TPR) repeat protein